MNNNWLYSDSEFGLLMNNFENYGAINISGINSLASSSWEDLWNIPAVAGVALHIYPAAAENVWIVCSVNDANTRGKTFRVWGLDTNFVPQEETVALGATATNAVALTKLFRRVLGVSLVAGQADLTACSVYVRNVNSSFATAPTFANVKATALCGPVAGASLPGNRSNFCGFTVPAGYTALIVALDVNTDVAVGTLATDTETDIAIMSRSATGAYAWVVDFFSNTQGSQMKLSSKFGVPLVVVGEKKDIKVMAKSDAGGFSYEISASMQIILVPTTNYGLGGIANL